MRARDKRMSGLIRMVKSRMTERRTQKGFCGEVDDALWIDVIGAYVKSLQKGISEFEKSNTDRATAQIEELRWEISQLEEYLPQKADEATTQSWVEAAITRLGGKEKAKLGAVMGVVMKGHKDEVEASIVRKIAQGLLG